MDCHSPSPHLHTGTSPYPHPQHHPIPTSSADAFDTSSHPPLPSPPSAYTHQSGIAHDPHTTACPTGPVFRTRNGYKCGRRRRAGDGGASLRGHGRRASSVGNTLRRCTCARRSRRMNRSWGRGICGSRRRGGHRSRSLLRFFFHNVCLFGRSRRKFCGSLRMVRLHVIEVDLADSRSWYVEYALPCGRCISSSYPLACRL